MDKPYQAAPDVHVIPTHLPIPGAGNLGVNAYVILAEQPVLVDTGLGIDSAEFIDALSSIVALDDLRWIWLTHDDSDHTGSIQRIMELAPKARLATHAFSALRMSTWWPVPLDRVFALSEGDRLDVGDRKLRALRPPLFDNPVSTGIFDELTGSLFSVDAFGAFIPEVVEDAADVPAEALAQGMVAWACMDSPWSHMVTADRFAAALDRVRKLAPRRVFSSHLPAAQGSVDRFLDILATVPGAEPIPAPNQAAFEQMLAAMAPAPA